MILILELLATKQKLTVFNSDSRMNVSSGPDSPLNGCPGLFSLYVQKMTIAPATNHFVKI